MEKFEGNGAECMVRFIADGCRGEITRDGESIIKAGRTSGSIWSVDGTSWLYARCTYTPPEPVWRDATNREALLAFLIDKGEVEYRLSNDAPIEADRGWHKVTNEYAAWTDPYRLYRIKEDA